jgi:PB1 domain
MESYAYTYPDSGESSPRSREIDSENGSHHHHASDEVLAHSAAVARRVKLMISYGGRIQPRPHDNQLSYLNGETKILSIDRSMRFADFHSKLTSVRGSDEFCIKYQLPGEDLDSLISVTNDEDLEHMVLEFDRLHFHRSSNSSRSTPRLRVFLFPINPPPPSPALLEPKQERHWFVDTINSIHSLAPPVAVSAPPAANGQAGPDFLFGLDNGFVPPPAVKIKDPAPPEQPVPRESATVEIPVKEDRQIGSDLYSGGSPPEIQRQIQELEKLQVTDNQPQPPQTQTQPQPQSLPQVQPQSQPQVVVTTMPNNGSDETLGNRAFLPKIQEKPPVPAQVQSIQQPSPQAPPATAVPQPTMTAPAGYIPRFQSIAGGDHQAVYVISHAPHGYFAAPPPGTASFMYAMPPPAPNHSAGGGGGDMSAGYGGAPVAAGYDNAGRAVYYTSMMPTAYNHHQAVNSMALSNTEAPKPVKPSQVS